MGRCMKSAFQFFKKMDQSQAQIDRDNTAENTSWSPQIQLKLSSGTSSLKRPIVLVGLLVIAASIFGYRYVIKSNEEQSSATIKIGVPKPVVSQKPTLMESKDQITKARRLFEKNQIEDSMLIYQNLLQKTPNDAQILNDIGVLYLKRKKLNESEVHLKKSIEIDPKCTVCLNNLGYLKTLQGENKSAELYLKQALDINDEYLDPYFNLGVLYEKNGDIARSANAYREFLSRSKDKDSEFNLKLKQHLFSILEK